ncbi:MAG: FecR family protein [Saprospiraceae bacterium]
MKIKEGLLIKYLNGTCSKKQEVKIQSWLAEDIAHSKELLRMKRIWSEMDGLKTFKTPLLDEEWKAMAGKVGIIGPSIISSSKPIAKSKTSQSTSSSKTIPKPIVDKMKPKDTFESTKSLERKYSGISAIEKPTITPIKTKANNSFTVVRKSQEDSIPGLEKTVYIVGALLAAGILSWLVFSIIKKKDPYKESIATEIAKHITLPDGTEVILAPFSRLLYPRVMNDVERRLSLYGSAEFDVVADTEPFIIEYNDISVMTLGTVFDLKQGDNFVTAECLQGKIRFFETANVTNGVEVNEGKIFKYSNGIFKDMSAPEQNDIEIPAIITGDVVRLDQLLDWLMEESDWKVISSPSMPIDGAHEVTVNLSSSYEKVLESLKQKIDISYSQAKCSGCYLIKKMKAL